MSAVIQVEDLPLTDRVDFLRDHMLHAAVPLELRPSAATDIQVRAHVADFGGVHLLSTEGTGAAVERTPRLARDDTLPSLVVSVVAGGSSVVTQHARTAHLRAGDIVAYLTTAPYTATFDTGTTKHSFQIPLDTLGLPFALINAQVARPLGPGRAIAPIITGYLSHLAQKAPSLSSSERLLIEQPTLDLVRSLLTCATDNEHLTGAPLTNTLGLRIMEFVELHVTDHSINAAEVARAHGISERYLYVVLGHMNVSFGDWIREERLTRAARALGNPSNALRSIASLAHQFGFADHAHFSRSFRQRFGTTPSQWRQSQNDANRTQL